MRNDNTTMNIPPMIVNADPISGFANVIIDGKTYTVRASDAGFADALACIAKSDFDGFVNIANPEQKLRSLYASYEGIEVKDGNLYVFGDQVHGVIAERVLNLLNVGINCTNVFKFMVKLQNNPSKRAVDELYTFLEHKNLPLTENGNFLAYKAVRNDFTDKHTGKFLNTVDSVLEMPRNKVDDNKEVGCSYGFHAGTLEYASDFASGNDRLVLVEINPADVVSIPTDCNFQKLRTCRYKVVSEYERPLTEPVYESRFQTDDDVDIWNDEEEEENYPTCSDCGEESYGNCDDCDCCEGCCNCDEEIQPDESEQLSLPLDNKMQSVDWTKQTVNLVKLVNHLFSSRRPAVAMSIRREFDYYDEQTRVGYEVLLNHTTEADAKQIYNDLNP